MCVGVLLLSLFGMSIATQAGNLESKTFKEYVYMVSDDQASIIDVKTDISGDVVIPSSMDGYPVTGICERAFDKCDQIVTLKIPASVTYIEEGAFEKCASLTKFIVAFRNKAFCTREGVLYSKDITRLICYPPAKSDTTFAVPDGVKKVDMAAFTYVSNLENITVADDVESLGDQAFYQCTALKQITFGTGLKKIGSETFAHCSALTSIRIPNSVQSVGTAAFMECSKLSDVTIGSGLTTLSGTLFLNCAALKTVAIPNNVTAIVASTFSGCSALETITLPKNVKSIGGYAFHGCDSLKTVLYTGSETKRSTLVIGSKNEAITAAQWQYGAPSAPTPAKDTSVGPQPVGGPDSNIIWAWVMIGAFAAVLAVAIVVMIVWLTKGIKRRK